MTVIPFERPHMSIHRLESQLEELSGLVDAITVAAKVSRVAIEPFEHLNITMLESRLTWAILELARFETLGDIDPELAVDLDEIPEKIEKAMPALRKLAAKVVAATGEAVNA